MLLFSWDNLSTKGTLHIVPDRLFVWNDRLRQEAVELHGIEPSRVVVTGAPRFDPFFELQVANTREAFCEPLRFDPAEPLLTYLCSSKFVSGDELTFVREWIARLRTSRGGLARCNVIVRPHPDVKHVDTAGARCASRSRRRRCVGPHPGRYRRQVPGVGVPRVGNHAWSCA